MKKTIFLTLLMLLSTLIAKAQDFDLYYAKNVTDVTNFKDIKTMDKELNWRKLDRDAIDGNLDEVRNVTEMFNSTRMKDINDQRMFWNMRDHMLLCFRINDGSGLTGSYRVEVNYGTDAAGNEIKKTLTTSSYFFTNMIRQDKEITIKVWKTTDPDHYYRLRYWVYDWNDDNVYIFQLDQKRQSTGDTYKLEYVTSYSDEEGEMHDISKTLELKETYFQSFYVPEGHTLTDMYFLTGNDTDGDVKLKVKLDELHSSIDLDPNFNIPMLTPKFNLAKHENRELMNFNWMGTGLFERFDTLYLKLFGDDDREIFNARINVHRVDENGRMVDDPQVNYLGYDAVEEHHLIVTHGHPAYLEILADGYLPTLYRYKGAAEGEQRIVSEDLCSAKLTLRSGSVRADEIAISSQHLRYLTNENVVITRSDDDYMLCSIQDVDLTSKAPVDTLAFMDNAGLDISKILLNDPVNHLAEIEVAFSSPKGGASPDCNLTLYEIKDHDSHIVRDKEVNVVSSVEFNKFSRDYYFTRFSLVNSIPYNQPCSMEITAPGIHYNNFPNLLSVKYDDDEKFTKLGDLTNEVTEPKDNTEDAFQGINENSLGFSFPPTFKFKLGKKGSIKTGVDVDVKKQQFSAFITISYSNTIDPKENETRLSGAREQAKAMQNWHYVDHMTDDKGNEQELENPVSMDDKKNSYDDWVMKQADDLFTPNASHIGFYYGGSAKLAVASPLTNIKQFNITELSLMVEGGAGAVWDPDDETGELGYAARLLEKVHLAPEIGFIFDSNLKFTGGLTTFDPKHDPIWTSKNIGVFSNLAFSVKLAAYAQIHTPANLFGSLNFGLRAGAKAQIEGGVAAPIDFSDYALGSRMMLLGIVEAYAHVRLLCFTYHGSIAVRAGKQWLWPNDADNPFHDEFPRWLEKSKVRTVANSYKPVNALAANSLGSTLYSGVAIDANPHFISPQQVVFNNLKEVADYNDDEVTVLNVADGTTQSISTAGKAATQHMRSKCGEKEIVVFQQYNETFDNDAVTDDNVVNTSLEKQKHTQIMASILQPDGQWKLMEVTPDDGMIDQTPVVTIQEDGKAAVVYQHGDMKIIDETVSADSVYNHRLEGQFMLRTYDGNTWSDAIPLLDINADRMPVQYDLMMRNDSVLIGISTTDEKRMESKMEYYAKAIGSTRIRSCWADLNPIRFFMNRVGQHAVITGIYEKSDGARDVYIKTLDMLGNGDGFAGCDLGIGNCNPERVKIICDRSDTESDDFAVLWTESSNMVHDAAAGSQGTEDMHTMLNASRVQLGHTPGIAYPLTVGSERDSLFLTDFDGYLDDNRINVVYTLADIDGGGAVIMQNEKYFINSFESDVTYSHAAILASSTMPVNVMIRNTGVSPIIGAEVNINGQSVTVPDVLVNPMSENTYVVQYPIPDNFDGYMSTSVTVTYANQFKADQAPAHGPYRARSMKRQTKAFDTQRVSVGDIDCNVVNCKIDDGGTNTYTVELIDRSSRGLMPGTGVSLGIFSSPIATRTLTGQAQTLVPAEDFKVIGGVRKAYAKVMVSGISEPISGYIVPHIVDFERTEEGYYKNIHNVRKCENAPYVNLFPSPDPTKIHRPELSREPSGHKVKISSLDNGIELSGLTVGDDVRIFEALGQPIFVQKATASTLFVPIDRHTVYIIAAGDEVFKFVF